MAITSGIRKPEVSLAVALATGTIVYTIYNRGMPTNVDMRATQAGGDANLEAVRKQNLWMAAAVVGGISLIAKDATVFIVGGGMAVGLDWLVRANMWTNPLSGRIDVNPFTMEKPSPAATAQPETATMGAYMQAVP